MIYYALATTAFIVATVVADIRARIALGGEPLDLAVREHFYWAGVQVVGTVMLFAPFALVAWWADRSEGRGRIRSARLIFTVYIVLTIWNYWNAYQLVPGYLAERMWTAASLTIGLLPFYAVGYLGLILVAWSISRAFLERRSRNRGHINDA